MTVTITQAIADIAGIDDDTVVWFYQGGDPRQGSDGTTMITSRRVSATPVSGTLTVELDPGPAMVLIRGRTYPIVVPDTDAQLWPLINTYLPAPPPPGSDFVRNFGGVAGALRITESAYMALDPPDPETLYAIVED